MMKRMLAREEVREMRFEEAYAGWNHRRLSQEEAAQSFWGCARAVSVVIRGVTKPMAKRGYWTGVWRIGRRVERRR
jgi:hypothetical protein